MKTIIVKEEFKPDYISREAGERLRKTIVQALLAKEALTIDFSDIIIASTSFLDESLAKLVSENDHLLQDLENLLTLKNLHPRDQEVLEKVCSLRKMPFEILTKCTSSKPK